MIIKTIIENTSNNKDLKEAHGVCLYIETKYHKILFDLGPNKKNLLISNANKMNIDLSNVDIVIISHGHFDHGGGLEEFLKINSKACIFIQSTAWNSFYSKMLFFNIYIGLNQKLKNHPQIKLIEGDYQIDDELTLITSKNNLLPSPMNNVLYKSCNNQKIQDDFIHEQSLLIKENKNVLFTGCSHNGIINILNDTICKYVYPDIQIGGFHLYNPINKKSVDDLYLDNFINELKKYQITFYTFHCTGKVCLNKITNKLNNVHSLNTGDQLEI